MPISPAHLAGALAEITGATNAETRNINRWLENAGFRKRGTGGRSGIGAVAVDEEYAARMILGLAAPNTKAAPALVTNLQDLHCLWFEGYEDKMPDELRPVLIGRPKRFKAIETKGSPKAYISGKSLLAAITGLIRMAQKPKGEIIVSWHVEQISINPVGRVAAIQMLGESAVRYFKLADGRESPRRINETENVAGEFQTFTGKKTNTKFRRAARQHNVSFPGEIFIALAELYKAA